MKYIVLLFLFLGCHDNSSSNNQTTFYGNLSSVPGLASAFKMNDQMVELNAYGVRKITDPTPIAPDDKFHLGSCTKAMTATLAAILIEEGHLTWTTKLGDIFTDMTMRPEYANMSFETLLVHRAGLPVNNDVFNQVWYYEPVSGRDVMTNTLLNLPPENPIDSTFVYTNFSYIIAGHALEKIMGQSWEDMIVAKLFNPLGMSSCGFGPTSSSSEIVPTQPWGHSGQMPNVTAIQFDNPKSMGPAGTVHCNLPDWSKFLTIHLKGMQGQGSLVSVDTFKKLHSVHPSGDSDYTYGGWMLLSRDWANGPVLHHAGSNTTNFALTWIAPNRNAILMSATNIGGDEGFKATDAAIGTFVEKYLSN